METGNTDRIQSSTTWTTVRAVYFQIVAAGGCFGLVGFFGHIFDFNWHGALKDLFGLWDIAVRPFMSALFEAIITKPALRFLHVHYEVPVLIRDYFGAGFVLVFSVLRVGFTRGAGLSTLRNKPHIIATDVMLFLIFWPLRIIEITIEMFKNIFGYYRQTSSGKKMRIIAYNYFLGLSPFIYFGCAILVNHFLLSQ